MTLKIGVYALARNEEKHVFDWSHSCDEADVRVVTDTGSTDSTADRLRQSGVTVATGNVVPWRWDDAHNLSLYHLPSDVDVCIRLDLDERLSPGWREVIEREWTDGTNQLFYRYVWSWAADGTEDLVFIADRIHSRHGFRWSAPTHEGLICWHGEKRPKMTKDLQIFHFRDKGKKHKTDLELLRIAVREAPHDARAQWYLAREMDYAGMPEAKDAFQTYLGMAGGIATERAFACRILWKLTGDPAFLVKATAEAPDEPEAWERLAFLAYRQREWSQVVACAGRAVACDTIGTHCSDPMSRTKAMDLLAVALWELGRRPEALTFARQALARWPQDARLRQNVAAMEHVLEGAA
jgi:tetratricopeptide (TPR) repeat protein